MDWEPTAEDPAYTIKDHKAKKEGQQLAIKRNTFELILMMWMNLEPIIQNEVCQKEKDKYYVLTHIYGL